MSFLRNASIRTKILSLILPLCLVGLAAAGFLSLRFKAADNAYFAFIAEDNAALVELARANRNLQGVAYDAYKMMAYAPQDKAFVSSLEDYGKLRELLFQRLDNAKTLLPELEPQIGDLIDKTKSVSRSRTAPSNWPRHRATTNCAKPCRRRMQKSRP